MWPLIFLSHGSFVGAAPLLARPSKTLKRRHLLKIHNKHFLKGRGELWMRFADILVCPKLLTLSNTGLRGPPELYFFFSVLKNHSLDLFLVCASLKFNPSIWFLPPEVESTEEKKDQGSF